MSIKEWWANWKYKKPESTTNSGSPYRSAVLTELPPKPLAPVVKEQSFKETLSLAAKVGKKSKAEKEAATEHQAEKEAADIFPKVKAAILRRAAEGEDYVFLNHLQLDRRGATIPKHVIKPIAKMLRKEGIKVDDIYHMIKL